MATKRWFAWSKDDRSGQWMVVNEGLESHIREYVKRMETTAKKHGMTVTVRALPEGTDPA